MKKIILVTLGFTIILSAFAQPQAVYHSLIGQTNSLAQTLPKVNNGYSSDTFSPMDLACINPGKLSYNGSSKVGLMVKVS